MSCVSCGCSTCCCVTSIPCVPVSDPCCVCPPVVCPTSGIPQLFEEISTFLVPIVGSGVLVSVVDASKWLVGCCVVVKDDTQSVEMQITSVDTDNNTIFIVNQGAPENPIPGTPMADPSNIIFQGHCTVAGVTPTTPEDDFRMLTSDLFVVPDVGANSTLKLEGNIGLSVGQTLFIEGGVCVRVVSVTQGTNETTVVVDGVSTPPGILVGSVIASGSFVVAADSCSAFTKSVGEMYLQDNATNLVVTAQDDFQQWVAGWVAGDNTNFTFNNDELVYNGSTPLDVIISTTICAEALNDRKWIFWMAVNNAQVTKLRIKCFVNQTGQDNFITVSYTLQPGDSTQLYVTNTEGTEDITITEANLVIHSR